MAIYHFHAKVIQRSKGRNVVAAAAYRRAAKLFDEQELRTWNYSNKLQVIHRELLVPRDAPPWAKSLVENHSLHADRPSEILWNKVTAAEKRVDAQLAREIEFALPRELTQSQNIDLAREFIQDQLVGQGMIADWSVHWEEGNPHVHVLLSMRELTEEGFGKKVVAWNHKELLVEWRTQWAEYANFHLRLHQHNVRIDHRSYEAQGIDLIPTVHQGQAVRDMARRGIRTDIYQEAHDIQRANLQRIAEKPERLLYQLTTQKETFTFKALAESLARYVTIRPSSPNPPVPIASLMKAVLTQIEYHHSVFTERTLAKSIAAFTTHPEDFVKALLQIKVSPELIALGLDERGNQRYTTKRLFALENNLLSFAQDLKRRSGVKISSTQCKELLEHHQLKTQKNLTEEQLLAVTHLLKPTAIACLVGRAGTGKSFTLGAVKSVLQTKGYRVQGVALSGKAADGLSKDVGIQSRTIESFRYCLQQQTIALTNQDVIIMDEAGMTDSIAMHAVLEAVHEARAKLILVGDPHQLQPVGPGATFRALIEKLGFAEIQTVYRQQEKWQREATNFFSMGRISEGLKAYQDRDCLHWEKSSQDAIKKLVQEWQKLANEKCVALDELLVMAHRNKDVIELNQRIRSARIQKGELSKGFEAETKLGGIELSPGDRILFLKNQRALGVTNGRFGTVIRLQTEGGKIQSLSVQLDGPEKQIVQINRHFYNEFTYGYAATIHKSQGATLNHALVYAGGRGWDRHLTYVAMTRHRESCHLYADQETHGDKQRFKKHLGRYAIKDSVLDFPLAFAKHRGIEPDSLGHALAKRVKTHLLHWRDTLKNRFETAKNFLTQQPQLSRSHLETNLKQSPTRPEPPNPLKDLFLHYVELELKQTELVHARYQTFTEGNEAIQKASEASFANRKRIQDFVQKAIQDPKVEAYLQDAKKQGIIKPTVGAQGGLKAIYERLKKGEVKPEDLQALARMMHEKVKTKTHSHSLQQTVRKGRKR